ncbi:hypothetical protein GCM10011492_11310 [Flexivirga endophytica]|uniref:Uncharacterized protein n=1 Tax=Flexivirga endophytica TaxID=1849103 RepID=A0A916WRK3_9MICO|nr:hypothetical protein [Flexivirga endophytica]GGB23189.1 hypothetical protein GCM10011492_11310 [Flexivirga endophytica]GHB57110.1 hypothetical protein GCM10008112_27850 [Flexivirga endophytica]
MAFARHYYSVVNRTAQRPKVGELEPLALDGCKTCDNHENTVQELVEKNQHFAGKELVIDGTEIYHWDSSSSKVKVMITEPAVNIVDATGSVVRSYDRLTGQGMVFELHWGSAGWRVAAIRVMTA